jgi:hypothetical protein
VQKSSEQVAPGIWIDQIDDGQYVMTERNGMASVIIHTTPKAREPFSVRASGNVGQEIIGPDGLVYAWTTDPVRAAHICKLLIAYKNVQDKKASSSSAT